MSSKEDIKTELREAGQRATAPRVAVLGALRSADRALSHAEVVAVLGESDWDRATIFRNLVKLEELDFARIASRVGGITRYEAKSRGDAPHVHPHFACRQCGQVTCILDATLTLPSEGPWQEALKDADLQLVGRCPDCRAA